MNVFDLFGLPDVHDLADRVLSGDVSTVRTAASAARDARLDVPHAPGAG